MNKVKKLSNKAIMNIEALIIIALVSLFGIHLLYERIDIELPAGETKLMQYINIMNNTVHFLNTEEEKQVGVDKASYMYTPDKYKEKYGSAPLPKRLFIDEECIVGSKLKRETEEEYKTKISRLLDKHFEKVPFEDACYKVNMRDLGMIGEVLRWEYGCGEENRKIYKDGKLPVRYDSKVSAYMNFLMKINSDRRIYNGMRVHSMVNNSVTIDRDRLECIEVYNKGTKLNMSNRNSTYISESVISYGQLISLFGTYYLTVTAEDRLAGLLVVSDTEGYVPDVLTEDLLLAIRILNSLERTSNANPIRPIIEDDTYYLATKNFKVEIPRTSEQLARSEISDISYIETYDTYEFGSSPLPVSIYEQDILQHKPETYLGVNVSYNDSKEEYGGYNVIEKVSVLNWDYEYDIREYLENTYECKIYTGKELLDNKFRHNLEQQCLFDLDFYAKGLLTDAFSRLRNIPEEISNIEEYETKLLEPNGFCPFA